MKAKADTVIVLPEQSRVETPPEGERMSVLGVGLLVLAGFAGLFLLKKREVDRDAGIG